MKKGNKTLKFFILFMILLILVCGVILAVREFCTVTEVEITGNEHYTEEEIKDLVMNGRYGNNSIYLSLKYKNKSINDIPFIEKMDVKVLSPTHIKIQVYEKALAGYIEYLGHFLYFDRDGIIVESATKEIDGIPFVTGLQYDHVALHEPLPVSDEKIFSKILTITQLLTKYNIPTDKIYFDASEDITLYFGTARAFLGTDKYIDEKINELSLLLPKLQGYSGVLHMENYTGEGGSFTFEKDDEKMPESIENTEENGENELESEDDLNENNM